ncbi:hypothetical protein FRC17_005543 [Serendipita sp. 399]|nr:hypothetical protein FRC17_005543 [Serendipita sp. 399]
MAHLSLEHPFPMVQDEDFSPSTQGAYPAEIIVDDFRARKTSGEKIELAVDQCHLERIENIKHLHIRFLADYELNSDVFLKLLGQVMRPPEMLTLDCGRAVPGASSAFSTPWCLNKIMNLSLTTSHLYLRFVGPRLELRDEDSWPSITTLEVEKPDHPFPLPKLVSSMPNLQRLIIRRNSREPHPHAYEWSNFPPHNRITYLQVPDLSFVGWHLTPYRGMFPALTELDVSSDELLRIFLEKHPQVPFVRVKGIGYSTSYLNWRDGDRLDDETSFGREQ